MAIDWDAMVLAPIMDTFGEPAVYVSPSQPSFSLTGVFDREHVEVSFDAGGAAVSSRHPVFGCRASAFPAGVTPAQGDYLTIQGATYRVMDVQPDGRGHVFLLLVTAT